MVCFRRTKGELELSFFSFLSFFDASPTPGLMTMSDSSSSLFSHHQDLVLANGSLPSAISSVPLERLEGIKQLKKNEWSKLVQQWLDMERISEESRDGFSGDLEVVDPIRSGAGGGNGVRVSGGVGRVEFVRTLSLSLFPSRSSRLTIISLCMFQTNALQRTKSLPAAASLVEEQLESLPFLVESARTRLARAQDSVVDRDTSRKEEASPTESGSSEELSYWTEQARLVASSVPVRSLTSLKEEDRPRNVVAVSQSIALVPSNGSFLTPYCSSSSSLPSFPHLSSPSSTSTLRPSPPLNELKPSDQPSPKPHLPAYRLLLPRPPSQQPSLPSLLHHHLQRNPLPCPRLFVAHLARSDDPQQQDSIFEGRPWEVLER